MGGILLKHTYMVFDDRNDEVAFARVRASGESHTEDIVLFESPGAQIPLSEDADPYCNDYRCDDDYLPLPPDDIYQEPMSAVIIVFICLGCIAVLAISFVILWFFWRHGYCCFRGRGKEKKLAAGRRRGPISENVVYAGALPYPTSPRPAQTHTLPLGCSWEPTMGQYQATASSSATTLAGPQSTPSGPRPAEPSAGAPEADYLVDLPTERPVSPLTPEPAAGPLSPPSAQPPAPGGTSPLAEDESPNPSETGNVAGRKS